MSIEKVLTYWESKTLSFVAQGIETQALYSQGGYGTFIGDNRLELDAYEAVHLLERGRLEVYKSREDVGNSEPLTLGETVELCSESIDSFWERYIVFKDIRTRGVIAKLGLGKFGYFKLYPRGATIGKDQPNVFVCPLREGKMLELAELDVFVKKAEHLKKKFVFALVDALGDVSYTTVSELKPISDQLINRNDLSIFDWSTWRNDKKGEDQNKRFS